MQDGGGGYEAVRRFLEGIPTLWGLGTALGTAAITALSVWVRFRERWRARRTRRRDMRAEEKVNGDLGPFAAKIDRLRDAVGDLAERLREVREDARAARKAADVVHQDVSRQADDIGRLHRGQADLDARLREGQADLDTRLRQLEERME